MLYNLSFKEMKQNCINIFKENKLDINTITNQDVFKSFVWYWTVYFLLIKHSKEEEIDYNDINIENKKKVEEDKNEKKEVIDEKNKEEIIEDNKEEDNKEEIIEDNKEDNKEFIEDNKEEIIKEKIKKLNTKDAEKIYNILWNKKNLYIFDDDDNIINVNDNGKINITLFSAFMFEFISNNMVLVSIDENLFNKFYISACKYVNIPYNLYNEVDPFKEDEEMFDNLINEDKGIVIKKDNFDQFIPNLYNHYEYDDDYDDYSDYYNDEDNYENEDNYEDDNLDYY